MAFDKTNPAHVQALKAEVANDPVGVGYAAVVDQTKLLLSLFNDPASNPGSETGNAPMTAQALLKAIYGESISSQDQFKLQLLYSSAQGLSSDLSLFKSEVKALATGISTAVDTIIRPLSRADVLFSTEDANGVQEFVTITRDDWFTARDL